MSRAGETLGNPVRIVLPEQLLVRLGAGTIGPRIAPAVEQIAALAAAAACVAGRFGRRRAVIDNPELAEAVNADSNLIEFGVVGHAVEVRPVGIDAWRPRGRGLHGRAAGRLGLVLAGVGGGRLEFV